MLKINNQRENNADGQKPKIKLSRSRYDDPSTKTLIDIYSLSN
ncbi:MAG: hypothetical protein QNJ55_06795 [Xenococcus sp. MO_188.B8]|nr:hypothetical protein [Xenococcus sp. MO_188.B8]